MPAVSSTPPEAGTDQKTPDKKADGWKTGIIVGASVVASVVVLFLWYWCCCRGEESVEDSTSQENILPTETWIGDSNFYYDTMTSPTAAKRPSGKQQNPGGHRTVGCCRGFRAATAR